MKLSNSLPRKAAQCLLGAGLLISASSAYAEKYVLNIFFPPSHFSRTVMNEWVDDVEKATEGRVSFEIAAGSLAPPPQQLNAVKNGIADAAITANVFIGKQAPLIQFSSIPFMISDAKPASVAHYRTYEKFLADQKYFKGVELLSTFHFAGAHLYSLGDTINSVDVLKNSKVWALPGAAATTMKDFGVSPVTGPAVKVSEPVSQGVVDVVYGITHESMVDFKASPYVKNITLFPKAVTSTSFSFFMNDRAWKKVSKEDQAKIMELSGEALSLKVGTAAQEAAVEGLKTMTDAGVKTADVDEALFTSLQDAAKVQTEDFNKAAKKAGLDGTEIIEYFQQQYDDVK